MFAATGVIFGSDDLSGCIHGVFEIISNSRDEAKKGFGKDIYVTRYCDGSIEVRDNGRGVPLDWNKAEERWNWDLVYCELMPAETTTMVMTSLEFLD